MWLRSFLTHRACTRRTVNVPLASTSTAGPQPGVWPWPPPLLCVRQTPLGHCGGGGSRGCSCALPPPRGQVCTAPAGPGAPRAVPGARASSHGPSVSQQAKDPSPVRLVPRPPPRPAPPETVLVPMSGRLPGSLWCGCFVLRLGSGDTLPPSVSPPLLVGREVHGVLQEAWGRAGPGAFAVQRPFA